MTWQVAGAAWRAIIDLPARGQAADWEAMADEKEAPENSSGSSGLVLTALQHRLITTALAALSVFVLCALLFLLFRLLSALVSGFSNVLLPLAVATILAMLLRPLVGFVEERTRLGRTTVIILLYFLVLLFLTAVLWWIIPVIIEQGVRFFRMLPAIYEGLREMIALRFPQLIQFLNETLGKERMAGLGETVQSQIAETAQGFMMKVASTGPAYFTKFFSLTAAAAIVPVYLFFFLRSNPLTIREMECQLSWIREDIREDIVFLMRQFAHSIETFFQGQVVVGLIMGILLAAGFSIAGIEFGFALGLLIGLLNIIPYLGTIIGLGSVLPVAYLQPDGGLTLVAVGLGIFIAVQMLEGYLLTPRIMGNRTGLHPLTIIIAIFFWGTALGGIMGMILAIPLTAFFVVAWRLLREKYLNQWTKQN